MNPHLAHSVSPYFWVSNTWRYRTLLWQMIKREVISRYQGSVMGIFWSFFHPVLMLAVYTFVFSVVFKARWNSGSDSKTEFALVLFSGLLIFNFFSECIGKAPYLILGNANFVKKVVFPLEILPLISLGSALFHTLVSFIVWLLFYQVFFGFPHPTILLLPLLFIPLILMTIGICWLLASLGVFLRDVGQIISIVVTAMMFMTPIFYPVSALPKEYQFVLNANPLTFIIEQARNAMIWGILPNWYSFGIHLLCSALIAWLGFAWFQKTRKGFADVI